MFLRLEVLCRPKDFRRFGLVEQKIRFINRIHSTLGKQGKTIYVFLHLFISSCTSGPHRNLLPAHYCRLLSSNHPFITDQLKIVHMHANEFLFKT
jgi:hypothetical protein